MFFPQGRPLAKEHIYNKKDYSSNHSRPDKLISGIRDERGERLVSEHPVQKNKDS
jgi:hypothetical protein